MSNLFQFATLGDLRENPNGPIWLSKETFAPYLNEYNERTHTDSATVLREWAHALLDSFTPHRL